MKKLQIFMILAMVGMGVCGEQISARPVQSAVATTTTGQQVQSSTQYKNAQSKIQKAQKIMSINGIGSMQSPNIGLTNSLPVTVTVSYITSIPTGQTNEPSQNTTTQTVSIASGASKTITPYTSDGWPIFDFAATGYKSASLGMPTGSTYSITNKAQTVAQQKVQNSTQYQTVQNLKAQKSIVQGNLNAKKNESQMYVNLAQQRKADYVTAAQGSAAGQKAISKGYSVSDIKPAYQNNQGNVAKAAGSYKQNQGTVAQSDIQNSTQYDAKKNEMSTDSEYYKQAAKDEAVAAGY